MPSKRGHFAALCSVLAVACLSLSLLGFTGVTAPASANDEQVCSGLDSGKIDVNNGGSSMTVTAPEGKLISGYCVKAGSSKQGDGPHSVTVNPPQKSVTISHPSGKGISHYSLSYATAPPTDACPGPELPGDQPPGTDCNQPANDRETRDLPGVVDCTADTYTVEHQERTREYSWDGDSWEPGSWSSWTTYDTTVTPATEKQCPPNEEKVKICHATSSANNPYVVITVSASAVDGVSGNSGNQPDHYGEHQGPIFDPEVHENGDDWGDIIPPVPPHHNGLNWTEEGQAVYDNGCALPDEPDKEVTPTAPTFTDPCGTADDTYTIPSKEGVRYLVDGVVTDAGTYPGTGSVIITAEAENGYVLVGKSSWTFTFTDEPCDGPPVYEPRGQVSANCQGNVRFVLDNRDSNTAVIYEIVVAVTADSTSSLRQVNVAAGDRKVVRYQGLKPATVLTVGALDVQLDRAVVPGKCDGKPPHDDSENPPLDQPNNPTYADTGMGTQEIPTASSGQALFYGLAVPAGLGLMLVGLGFMLRRRNRHVEASV